MNRNRIIVKAQVASGLARCRAHTPRELRKRVRQGQPRNRIVQPAVEQQIVRLGNQVVQRTAGRLARAAEPQTALAERHPAVHATACLSALLIAVEIDREITVVEHSLRRGTDPVLAAPYNQIRSRGTHDATSYPSSGARRSARPGRCQSSSRTRARRRPHGQCPIPRAARRAASCACIRAV